MSKIEFRAVSKRYTSDTLTINDATLTIEQGEFFVFVGPSGCGKSTLLRMVAGLEEITSGDLSIDGERVNDYPPSRRGVAMVFQSYALYPHMTVRENMGFGLKVLAPTRPKSTPKLKMQRASCSWTTCLTACPRRSPAGNGSGWRSGAPLSNTRRYSCSTNRCPTWTPRCGYKPAWKSPNCITTSAARA